MDNKNNIKDKARLIENKAGTTERQNWLNNYTSMSNAYDTFMKQMGGSVSTKNPNPCGPNCHCVRMRKLN